MKVRPSLLLALSAISMPLAGCDLPPPSPERAAERCEERARGAQGPRTEISLGVNSNSGGFASGSVGISSDFLRGLDPITVYENCVQNLTGQPPIRPPQLR